MSGSGNILEAPTKNLEKSAAYWAPQMTSEVYMFRNLGAFLGAALLASCVPPGEASVPVNVRPISLSNSQISAIKRGLFKTVLGAVDGSFGPMQASSNGRSVYVCGYFIALGRSGYVIGTQTTYFGTLSAAAGDAPSFSPQFLGTDDAMRSKNSAICSRYGISVRYYLE